MEDMASYAETVMRKEREGEGGCKDGGKDSFPILPHKRREERRTAASAYYRGREMAATTTAVVVQTSLPPRR